MPRTGPGGGEPRVKSSGDQPSILPLMMEGYERAIRGPRDSTVGADACAGGTLPKGSVFVGSGRSYESRGGGSD